MRFVLVVMFLSVAAATASAKNCTDDCDAARFLDLQNCAVAEENASIECQNLEIQNSMCAELVLECQLCCLEMNGSCCHNDCSSLCDQFDVAPCWQEASANRVLCDEAANLAHATCLDECAVSSVPLPSSFALHFAAPNPFNPSTRISWSLPAESDAKLEIFDSKGRHVVTLVDGWVDAGQGSVLWRGKDSMGTRASSGVYFYRLRAGNFEDTKRMLLLK